MAEIELNQLQNMTLQEFDAWHQSYNPNFDRFTNDNDNQDILNELWADFNWADYNYQRYRIPILTPYGRYDRTYITNVYTYLQPEMYEINKYFTRIHRDGDPDIHFTKLFQMFENLKKIVEEQETNNSQKDFYYYKNIGRFYTYMYSILSTEHIDFVYDYETWISVPHLDNYITKVMNIFKYYYKNANKYLNNINKYNFPIEYEYENHIEVSFNEVRLEYYDLYCQTITKFCDMWCLFQDTYNYEYIKRICAYQIQDWAKQHMYRKRIIRQVTSFNILNKNKCLNPDIIQTILTKV